MKHRYSSFLSPIHIIIDTLCLNFSFLLSYYLKFNAIDGVSKYPYIVLFLLVNLIWAVLLLIIRPYKASRINSSINQALTNLLTTIALHAAVTAFYWLVTQAYYYSRIQLMGMYTLFFTLGFVWRIIFTWAIRQYRLQGFNIRKYIILGASDLSNLIIKYHQSHPELGYHYDGYFGDAGHSLPQWRGNYGCVREYIEKNNVDYIYCYLPKIDNKFLTELINSSSQIDCEVKLLMDFSGFMSNKVNIEYHDFIPIVNVSSTHFNETKDEVLKRGFDIIFSSISLIAGAPLLILIALLTKLSSKGPILFKQERTGRWGEKFIIYKFRSMYVNSEQIHSKGKADPRITAWGHFIRKTRLDELPQLYNVLKGDMSFVGPRPLANYDSKTLFENMPDEYKLLLSVKPGLTSVGQVNFGYASNKDEIIERAREDLAYIPSFQKDIILIFQTLRVMVQRRGK